MAVIGHYSSEMTATALAIYDRSGIPLINSSSTSDELSSFDSIAFYRLTTLDLVNARHLIEMLAVHFSERAAVKVAIIYNHNSSYSKSCYQATVGNLERYSAQFTCLTPYPSLSADYYQVREYLGEIDRQQVDIVIIIADGGVEPNSLNNIGAIINRQNCWIVGSATLYQENVLHWLDEQNAESISQIMACVPWHWQSPTNGCQSKNITARKFCQLGTHLWGKGNLTWRSATAFDSASIVIDTLVRYQQRNNGVALQTSAALLEQMDLAFKKGKQVVKGVTGQIKFDRSNGDRLDPPAEIVRVQYDPDRQKWQWTCDPQLLPK